MCGWRAERRSTKVDLTQHQMTVVCEPTTRLKKSIDKSIPKRPARRSTAFRYVVSQMTPPTRQRRHGPNGCRKRPRQPRQHTEVLPHTICGGSKCYQRELVDVVAHALCSRFSCAQFSCTRFSCKKSKLITLSHPLLTLTKISKIL